MRRLAPRGVRLGVPAQHLDVLLDGLARRLEVLVGDVGEVGRVDDHVHVGHRLEVAELAQLQRGEGGLQRAAAPDHHDLLDAARVQRLQRVVGDVGVGQHVGVADQDARDVERDVAVADHDGAPGRQVRRHLLEVRVGVVPADEVDGGDAAGQLLAGNAQRSVGLRADGVDRRRRSARRVRPPARARRPRCCRRSGSADRAPIFSNCALIVLIFGWSGATPERTRPHGVGSISSMSTRTSRL